MFSSLIPSLNRWKRVNVSRLFLQQQSPWFGMSFKLLIQYLNDICCPKRDPFFFRKIYIRQTWIQLISKTLYCRRDFRFSLVFKVFEKFISFFLLKKRKKWIESHQQLLFPFYVELLPKHIGLHELAPLRGLPLEIPHKTLFPILAGHPLSQNIICF